MAKEESFLENNQTHFPHHQSQSLPFVFEGLQLHVSSYVTVMRTTVSDLHCTTNTAFPVKELAQRKSLLPTIRPASAKGTGVRIGDKCLSSDQKLQESQKLKEERELFYSKLKEEKAMRMENRVLYDQALVAALIQDFLEMG